jgi:hypothetical protein
LEIAVSTERIPLEQVEESVVKLKPQEIEILVH